MTQIIGNINNLQLIFAIDERPITYSPTHQVTYIGKAKIGSSGSDAVWEIRKIELTGTVTTILYAEGSKRFNKVWDDRESYSYS